MPFIPATPGIVGFGGGEKPAAFQAIAPQYSLMNQQDDETTPVFCHDALGDTINAVVANVLACSGCYTIDVGGGPFDIDVSFTGSVNGAWAVLWDGSQWVVAVDTLTVNIYASGDGTCVGLTDTKTAPLTLTISCSGGNALFVNVTATITFGITPVGFTIFAENTGTEFGNTIVSTLTLGMCGGDGNIPPFLVVAGHGGTMVLSLP